MDYVIWLLAETFDLFSTTETFSNKSGKLWLVISLKQTQTSSMYRDLYTDDLFYILPYIFKGVCFQIEPMCIGSI